MKWITDRNPKSKGLYMAKGSEGVFFRYELAYWDRIGWKRLCDTDSNITIYFYVESWAKIEIGEDYDGGPTYD